MQHVAFSLRSIRSSYEDKAEVTEIHNQEATKDLTEHLRGGKAAFGDVREKDFQQMF